MNIQVESLINILKYRGVKDYYIIQSIQDLLFKSENIKINNKSIDILEKYLINIKKIGNINGIITTNSENYKTNIKAYINEVEELFNFFKNGNKSNIDNTILPVIFIDGLGFTYQKHIPSSFDHVNYSHIYTNVVIVKSNNIKYPVGYKIYRISIGNKINFENADGTEIK